MAIISSKIGDQHFAYPFIADAPFSAFGKNFINNFFDAVPNVFNQSIIMIKDLYDIDAYELITEDGKQILTKMKTGEIPGTFYVNAVNEVADTTGLETEIKPYKKPAYE
jgi:DNA sulfur modification protein DndD